jgi:competence protein ComEA
MALPGIGEVMALRIIEGRPYSSAKDLLRVPGIGQKTLEKLWPYLTFSQKKG